MIDGNHAAPCHVGQIDGNHAVPCHVGQRPPAASHEIDDVVGLVASAALGHIPLVLQAIRRDYFPAILSRCQVGRQRPASDSSPMLSPARPSRADEKHQPRSIDQRASA